MKKGTMSRIVADAIRDFRIEYGRFADTSPYSQDVFVNVYQTQSKWVETWRKSASPSVLNDIAQKHNVMEFLVPDSAVFTDLETCLDSLHSSFDSFVKNLHTDLAPISALMVLLYLEALHSATFTYQLSCSRASALLLAARLRDLLRKLADSLERDISIDHNSDLAPAFSSVLVDGNAILPIALMSVRNTRDLISSHADTHDQEDSFCELAKIANEGLTTLEVFLRNTYIADEIRCDDWLDGIINICLRHPYEDCQDLCHKSLWLQLKALTSFMNAQEQFWEYTALPGADTPGSNGANGRYYCHVLSRKLDAFQEEYQ